MSLFNVVKHLLLLYFFVTDRRSVMCQIVYENANGAARVKLAKDLLNENLQTIYNFQDNVRFSWHESQRNVGRLLVQINSGFFNLERLQGRFERKIKTSEDSNYIARLRLKRIQMFSNVFDDLFKESGKLRMDITNTLETSVKHNINVIDGTAALTSLYATFSNLNTTNLQEMYELSREIFELNETIKAKLRARKHKSNAIIALEASLMAVELASLGSMTGGPIGYIIAGTTMAASTALALAKSELESDLRELTAQYLKSVDKRRGKIVEQMEIDLDTESKEFFMERLSKVSLSLVKTREQWKKILFSFQELSIQSKSLEVFLEAYRRVTEKDIFKFFELDLANGKKFSTVIQSLSEQLKMNFD